MKPYYQKMKNGNSVRVPGMYAMDGAEVGDEPTAQDKAKKQWKRKKVFGRIGETVKGVFKGTGDKELCTKGGKC